MRVHIKYVMVAIFVALTCCVSMAQPGGGGRGRKIQNLPFADYKRVHFGFSVGTHVQDLTFTHNGYTSPEGENWYMEVPLFRPVSVLILWPTSISVRISTCVFLRVYISEIRS